MNVCREKEEASPRASSRIAFVPALALPGSKDGRLAGLGSAKDFAPRQYIDFFLLRAPTLLLLIMHLHTHSSDHLACFKAQTMPRSSAIRQLAQGKMCMPSIAKQTISKTKQTSPRFYACDLAPKHSQAAYLIYVSVEEKPLFMGAEIDSRVFSTLPPSLIGN